MMSSSLSNTTPISNFKSISLTVIEFWKRYHQKPLYWKELEVETWTKNYVIINVFFSIVNSAAVSGANTTVVNVFLALF
jgi:hypothetical protein